MKLTLPTYILAGAILLLASALFFTQSASTEAGWWGWQSHIQSATTTTVGPDTNVTLFADQVSATCHSRIVTTRGSAIVISFDDVTGYGSTTMALTDGHIQASSTTVAYDSGTYGCGRMTALGWSSTTITTSSF